MIYITALCPVLLVARHAATPADAAAALRAAAVLEKSLCVCYAMLLLCY